MNNLHDNTIETQCLIWTQQKLTFSWKLIYACMQIYLWFYVYVRLMENMIWGPLPELCRWHHASANAQRRCGLSTWGEHHVRYAEGRSCRKFHKHVRSTSTKLKKAVGACADWVLCGETWHRKQTTCNGLERAVLLNPLQARMKIPPSVDHCICKDCLADPDQLHGTMYHVPIMIGINIFEIIQTQHSR